MQYEPQLCHVLNSFMSTLSRFTGKLCHKARGYKFMAYSDCNITILLQDMQRTITHVCLSKRMLPLCTRAEMELLNAIFSRGF